MIAPTEDATFCAEDAATAHAAPETSYAGAESFHAEATTATTEGAIARMRSTIKPPFEPTVTDYEKWRSHFVQNCRRNCNCGLFHCVFRALFSMNCVKEMCMLAGRLTEARRCFQSQRLHASARA